MSTHSICEKQLMVPVSIDSILIRELTNKHVQLWKISTDGLPDYLVINSSGVRVMLFAQQTVTAVLSQAPPHVQAHTKSLFPQHHENPSPGILTSMARFAWAEN
jgi:hypothetical protein